MTALLFHLVMGLPAVADEAPPPASVRWNDISYTARVKRESGPDIRYFGRSKAEFLRIEAWLLDVEDLYWGFTGRSPAEVCKQTDIDLLDISLAKINDKQRMRWVSWYSIEHKVYGLYRPTYTYRERAEVFISYDPSISEAQRAYLVGHEMSHYWQDMLCLEQSEEEADLFGRHFMHLARQ